MSTVPVTLTMVMEIPLSLLFAPTTGDTVAMALEPHTALPAPIKRQNRRPKPNRRPIRQAAATVRAIWQRVNATPPSPSARQAPNPGAVFTAHSFALAAMSHFPLFCFFRPVRGAAP